MSFIELAKQKYGKNFAKQSIQEFMKKNKLDTIEELLKKCKNRTDFIAACKYQEPNYANIINHHGTELTDELYNELIEMIKQEEIEKQKLKVETETTIVNGKELVSVTDKNTGENKLFDNTVSNRTIEAQMETVQKEHTSFQSLKDNNTENVMNYMEENIKITPDTQSSSDLNDNMKNNEEKDIMYAVKVFENSVGHPVEVDLFNKIIYDNGTIYTIEKIDGVYTVVNHEINKENKEENVKKPQLVMKKSLYDKAS